MKVSATALQCTQEMGKVSRERTEEEMEKQMANELQGQKVLERPIFRHSQATIDLFLVQPPVSSITVLNTSSSSNLSCYFYLQINMKNASKG